MHTRINGHNLERKEKEMPRNSVEPITVMAYNFKVINEEETEIDIYDVIRNKKTKDLWTGEEDDAVTPSDFKERLSNVHTNNITIRMNSSGGEVNAANVIAVAIQDAKKDGKHFTCKIDGICASAAVQIAMVCDEVIIHKSALMMIHNPAVLLFGVYSINDLNSPMNLLKATKDSIISYYEDKTGMSKQKLSNMMDDETYMTGEEAVSMGFADSIMFEEEKTEEDVFNNIKAVVNCNQSLNIPDAYVTAINNIKELPTKGETSEMEIKTVTDLMNAYPELTNELTTNAVAKARDEAIEGERNRIKAIDELAGKVDNALLNEAKYETIETAENVAMKALKTGAFVQAQVINALEDETAPANGVKGLPTDGAGVSPAVDEKKQATDKASQVALDYLKKMGKAGK